MTSHGYHMLIYGNNERRVILVGAAALCWAIWRCRNDIIFNKTKYSLFMQTVFRGTYWLRLWAQLQRKDMIKVLFRRANLALETVALEIANHRWKHNLRIGLDHFSFVHPQLANRRLCFVIIIGLCKLCRGRNSCPLSKKIFKF